MYHTIQQLSEIQEESLNQKNKMNPKIWLSSPHMGEKEFEYVKETFESNWIAPLGPNVDGFEKDLADFLDDCIDSLREGVVQCMQGCLRRDMLVKVPNHQRD